MTTTIVPALNQLVETLAPKGHVPPEGLRIFIGFVGSADRDDHLRLYRSLSLDSHIEVPKAAIKASFRLGATDLEPTAVWVLANAPVKLPAATASSFLTGAIMNNYYASTPGTSSSSGGGFHPNNLTFGSCLHCDLQPQRGGHITHTCGGAYFEPTLECGRITNNGCQ
jgi:hypothetical protein